MIMTYRELLEQYKNGQLKDSEKERVEADIERQDAISEYLYENGSIPDFDDLTPDTLNSSSMEKDDASSAETGDTKFVAMIERSIHRAFVKLGVTVGAAVLVLTLCAVFLLPQVVSLFFYNPNKVVGRASESGITTTQMSLDLSIYTELFVPSGYRNEVIANSNGYGSYDIVIPQTASYTSRFTTVSGRLERGKLTLYNPDVLRLPTANAFVLPESISDPLSVSSEDGTAIGPFGTKEKDYEMLSSLSDTEWYTAYVSLSDIMSYDDFIAWLDSKKDLQYASLWCAVYTSGEDGSLLAKNIGFTAAPSGTCLDWDRNAYPNLCLLDNADDSFHDYQTDSSALTTHFISLLSYLQDHDEIVSLFGNSGEVSDYSAVIDSVSRDGLRLYGFAIGAKKDTILSLRDDANVSYIYTTPLQ